MNAETKAIKATYFSIISNILMALIKGLAGFFGNSYALIADAIESTTDVFSSITVLLGLKFAHRPADSNHPYGHGKIEPLVTFIVVALLISAALVIIYQSIQNILLPHKTPEAWTLILLALIIGWKEISYRVVLKKGKETNSSSLMADAWHHRSDAITSVIAFLGISIALIFGKGFESADDWAAILASFFIIYNSYLIFRPAFGEIMDENLHEDVILEVRKVALTVEGVIATEKCFVRKFGMYYHVDLHAVVDGELSVRKGHDIAHSLKDTIKEVIPGIQDVFIHIEPSHL